MTIDTQAAPPAAPATPVGFFIAWDGLTYFMKGADVTGQPEFWIADLRKYILPGILWIAGGLGFMASAIGLWSASEKARVIGLYSGAALVAGWVLIKIISLGCGLPALLLSLFIGLPALVFAHRRSTRLLHLNQGRGIKGRSAHQFRVRHLIRWSNEQNFIERFPNETYLLSADLWRVHRCLPLAELSVIQPRSERNPRGSSQP